MKACVTGPYLVHGKGQVVHHAELIVAEVRVEHVQVHVLGGQGEVLSSEVQEDAFCLVEHHPSLGGSEQLHQRVRRAVVVEVLRDSGVPPLCRRISPSSGASL